jgi:hypothetical protein
MSSLTEKCAKKREDKQMREVEVSPNWRQFETSKSLVLSTFAVFSVAKF